jgi:F0F1-type ATP synthase membrane subunit b/b'
MIASRAATRAFRATRYSALRQHPRFQSTSHASNTSSSNPALIGGLAGGITALVGGYAWYHFSGAKTLVNTAHDAKGYIQAAQKRVTESAPKPNEALKWLRQVATYYAGFVPGASGYVDTAMNDLDKIHEKHADEVDKIVQDAYNDLKKAGSDGISLAAATKAWDMLQKHIARIGELAGDAAEDILDNHPEIKKQLGGNLEQLKKMGSQYGPEAKKQVDQTWDQIKDITSSGFGPDTADKIRKLVQEKVDMLSKLGDEAWKKGLEKAKPYLDKNPKVKKLIEENANELKQGNLDKLYQLAKSAVDSGDTGDLEKYVKDAVSKVTSSGGAGFDSLLKNLPGGEQMLPKLKALQEAAQKHGDEAKDLLEETVKEISDVLSRKGEDAKKLAQRAEESTKQSK